MKYKSGSINLTQRQPSKRLKEVAKAKQGNPFVYINFRLSERSETYDKSSLCSSMLSV